MPWHTFVVQETCMKLPVAELKKKKKRGGGGGEGIGPANNTGDPSHVEADWRGCFNRGWPRASGS